MAEKKEKAQAEEHVRALARIFRPKRAAGAGKPRKKVKKKES